jgi:hypothetical protein
MATWTAYVKETKTRRLTIEVEADNWEIAEDKARAIALAAPDNEWETDYSRSFFDIDVEKS